MCNKESCQQKDQCQHKYIGETKRKLKERISEHIGYVNTKNIEQATCHHFNLTGHNLSNMKLAMLEQVFKLNQEYRKEIETYLIITFNTYYKGMNKKP